MIPDKINKEIQLAINLAKAGKVVESQRHLEHLVALGGIGLVE